MRDASLPSSMRPMSDLLAFDSPTSRSTASGGAVHMRSIGSTPGLCFSVAALMLRRSPVVSKAALTSSVAWMRVVRNAAGAYWMNHWLNWSTEAAISAFQRCGLSALIRFSRIKSIKSIRYAATGATHVSSAPLSWRVAPWRADGAVHRPVAFLAEYLNIKLTGLWTVGKGAIPTLSLPP